MLAHIKGWQFVIKKNEDGSPMFGVGEKVVYIPIDSVLSKQFAEEIGVASYLSQKTDATGSRVLVVRQAKLRGEPSFGIVIRPDLPGWKVGLDVAEYYGITKFMAPFKSSAGDAMPDHPLFTKYTDIENMRHFPNVIAEGETVVVTEKIHGTNCRIAMIDGELMAGSMEVRRKPPINADQPGTYWFPLSIPQVREMMENLYPKHQAILFGEVFGSSIQSLHYGCRGRVGFRAFDLLVDGKYADWKQFVELTDHYHVDRVPTLDIGPFNLEKVRCLSGGKTVLDGDHIREGVVVKPIVERTDPKIGRVILKYISDEYLLSKGISDSQDV